MDASCQTSRRRGHAGQAGTGLQCLYRSVAIQDAVSVSTGRARRRPHRLHLGGDAGSRLLAPDVATVTIKGTRDRPAHPPGTTRYVLISHHLTRTHASAQPLRSEDEQRPKQEPGFRSNDCVSRDASFTDPSNRRQRPRRKRADNAPVDQPYASTTGTLWCGRSPMPDRGNLLVL